VDEDETSSDRLSPIHGLVQLNRLLFTDLAVDSILEQIADLSRRTIPQADQVSVTLMSGDVARTVVFTGDIARELDERQYETGFGPCTDAALSGRTIPVALDKADNAYPSFSVAGQQLGIRNTLSVGLPVPERIIGGINFYSHSELPFDDDAVELAEVFASYAAVVLLNGANLNTVSDLPDQVRAAFRSRITIETAKGVLMARNFSSYQAAYEELQLRAATEHRSLPEVAQSILDGIRTDNTSEQSG
jgi:GAF domain-containing protein